MISIQNPHDAVAGGLCLGGNDAEAFAHQDIHQRRFAHVGFAYDAYKASFMIDLFHFDKGNDKTKKRNYFFISKLRFCLVAGTGLEPVTFGL